MILRVRSSLVLAALAAAAPSPALVGQTASAAPPGARVVPVVTHDFAFTLPDRFRPG